MDDKIKTNRKNNRAVTAVAIICLLVIVLLTAAVLWMNGAFAGTSTKEISRFDSPDGQYTLIFQQVGDPSFPYGPTEVRLVLRDASGKTVCKTSATLLDDGSNADVSNIRTVEWLDDCVEVTLCASEMDDLTVFLKYAE